MPDAGMRIRVERLLRGDVSPDDLTRLFLFARDRCDGRESVQEVGDFVAHHAERTKGIVTQTVRDWVAILRSQTWSSQPLDPQHLPAEFPKALHATARRLDEPAIKKQLGISRTRLAHSLPSIISKFHENADGTFALYPFHTEKELEIIDLLASSIVARPAFTAARLFDEFSTTLKSNGLASHKELRILEGRRHFVILYAAIAMHRCVIVVGETFRMTLSTFGHPGGFVQVDCAVPVKTFRVATAMFSTELKSSEYCDESLMSIKGEWDFPLELSPEGQIRRLE